MEDKIDSIVPEEVNSIKLTKNTKGYNWEIKIKQNGKFKTMDAVIDEIDRVNTELNNRFSMKGGS